MPNFVPGVGGEVLLYILNTTPEMDRWDRVDKTILEVKMD